MTWLSGDVVPEIPRDHRLDSSLAFARNPYDFISSECRRRGTDLFQTRLMLRKTIGMYGKEAAELFYDPERFIRRGAMPMRIRKTLVGRGGVQGLDGDTHRHRKQMFISLVSDERVAALVAETENRWRRAAEDWTRRDRIVLYDAARYVLSQAVCAWAGVPLAASEVHRRTEDLTAMFQDAGTIGLRHWQARAARKRAEGWTADLIVRTRTGQLSAPADSALHVIATHRDVDGRVLPPRIAAVELLNVLRPTVAVSVFITFAAVALHQHSAYRSRVLADSSVLRMFVQEVRRFFPFFPAVAARVRETFEWRGYRFDGGTHVMLDLHGTNHDERVWREPDAFRPERFLQWDGSPFNFIPQGGGDHYRHHRCPGEGIAIALMESATTFLAGRLSYTVPAQDFRIDMRQLPALPRSGVVLSSVRPAI